MCCSWKIFKPSQFSTFLLVWTCRRTIEPCPGEAALLLRLLARKTARLGLAIERLRDDGRPPLLRKRQDFQLQSLFAAG